jgi:hypothetical protein
MARDEKSGAPDSWAKFLTGDGQILQTRPTLSGQPGQAEPQRPSTVGRWSRTILVAFALASPAGSHAVAEPGAHDLRLMAQSMGFLLRPPTGTREVGIVYPAGSVVGQAEAERIKAAFGAGLQAGPLTLVPRLLTVAEAVHEEQAAALLLTDAALPQANALAAAIAGKGMLTIASDPAVVTNGEAVMAVRSEPRVEIYVSRAAAQTAGVEFSTAFRMMIQER